MGFMGGGAIANKVVKRWLLWSTKRGYAFAPVDFQSNAVPKIDASLLWTVFDGVGLGYSEDPDVKGYMVQEGDEARDEGNEGNNVRDDRNEGDSGMEATTSDSDSACASTSSC